MTNEPGPISQDLGAKPPKQKTPFIYSWWALLGSFFVVGPLILPLVWRHPLWSSRTKWIVTAIIVIFTMAMVGSFVKIVQEALKLLEPL